MVDKNGIRPDPDAVDAVLIWKSPKTEHLFRQLLQIVHQRLCRQSISVATAHEA